jgi:hypothetical protein
MLVRVFFLNGDGRVAEGREIEVESHAHLRTQLEPELSRFAMIEAWEGSICVLRLGELPADL